MIFSEYKKKNSLVTTWIIITRRRWWQLVENESIHNQEEAIYLSLSWKATRFLQTLYYISSFSLISAGWQVRSVAVWLYHRFKCPSNSPSFYHSRSLALWWLPTGDCVINFVLFNVCINTMINFGILILCINIMINFVLLMCVLQW